MRPKHYPYLRNQWEKKTTVLYSVDNREYCCLNREVNRITGEVRGWETEEPHVEFLEAQLEIGKAVIESMLELVPKKGTDMAIIPVTIESYEFEVEVRMKWWLISCFRKKLMNSLKNTMWLM